MAVASLATSFLRAPALASYRKRQRLPRTSRLPFFCAPSSRLAFSSSSSSSSSSAAAVATPAFSHLKLEKTQVIVQGRELAVVQPRDVDQVVDMYIKQDRLEGDPFWCRIWPSAIVLVEEMLKNTQLVANLCVCDLGSGLGLAGVSALLAGAKEVVFYDQEPLALFCSLLTVHANIPHATTNLPFMLQQMCSDKTTDYVEYLAYGLALSPEIFEPGNINKGATLMARAEIFDWSEKRMHTMNFDTVLACDLLYERTSVPYIAEILPELIQHGGSGKVIMTDPTHRTPHNRQNFLSLLTGDPRDMGLKIERSERVKLTYDGKIEDVELMQFRYN